MFEHTSLLSSKGHYETTASHVEAVRNRVEEPAEVIERRTERRAVARRNAVDRIWNERRRMRRQRTAS
jgi:hypothetical protein